MIRIELFCQIKCGQHDLCPDDSRSRGADGECIQVDETDELGNGSGDGCQWIPDCRDFSDGNGLPLLINVEVDGGAEGKLLDVGSLVSILSAIYVRHRHFLSNDIWGRRS